MIALSPQQQRLCALSSESSRTVFSTHGLVAIEGPLDESLLVSAVERTVKCLEILRTVFRTPPREADPVQALAEPRIDWHAPLDLSGLSPGDRDARLGDALRRLRSLPFDLEKGPVLRACLVRRAAADHLLWLGLPALCADAAGFDNLAREIAFAYGADPDAAMEDEPVQYADLASWLNGLFEQESTQAERDDWQERLASGAVPCAAGFMPRDLDVELPPGVAERLRALARAEGAALWEILLAGWFVLLGRATGEPEPWVGVAFDGRDFEDLIPAVGLLARFLPLVARIDAPQADLRSIVRQVRRDLGVAAEIQQFFRWPLGGTMTRLRWGFEAGDPPAGCWPARDAVFSVGSREACLEPFLLKLSCEEGEGALRLRLVYDASALGVAEVQAWAIQLRTLLAHAVLAPRTPVLDLSLLDGVERHRVVREYNDTHDMWVGRPEESLRQMLSRAAGRASDRVAVEHAGETLTYADLGRRAARIAEHLRARGVGPEVPVGFFAEAGFGGVAGLLGTLAAGGAALPLDPEDPAYRLDRILRDADPLVLLGSEGLRARLPDWAAPRLLDPGSLAEEIAGEGGASPDEEPGTLACLVYSPGATDRPEGMMLSRAAVAGRLASMRRRFPLGAADRVLLRMPFSAGASILDILLPLVSGATLVLAPEGGPEGGEKDGTALASFGGIVLGRSIPIDARWHAVPAGFVGELAIAGEGLARGYFGRPDLTAERFVPDSFADRPGARLLRTGDLARRLLDGALELVGRRGRLELAEIETALRRHPRIREAVVALRGEPHDPRLVAYLVTEPNPAAERDLLSLADGLEVRYLNRSEAELIHQEIFEGEVYLKHGVRLADGDCVFDVGANIGLFTLFVYRHCRSPRVYAFEPVPAVFDRLRGNAALYGLDAELFRCGLAESSREAEFTFYPHWSAMSGLYPDLAEEEKVTRASLASQDPKLARYADELIEGRFEAETFVARLRTISEILRDEGIARIDLLKIDVEKSELDVLRGIRAEDWPKIGQIVVELHDTDGRFGEVQDLLRDQGYRVVAEEDPRFRGTGLYNLYAVREAWAGRTTQAAPVRLERFRASPEALRGFLASRLPAAMIPSDLVLVEALPRDRHGEIDSQALLALEEGSAERWQELGGREDDAWARAAAPDQEPGQRFAHLPPLEPIPRDGELALSFPQQRLWLLDQMDPGNLAYVIPGALRLSGALNVAALRASFTAIVARHEVLRTTFHPGRDQPVQVVAPPAAVPLPRVDLSGLAPAARGHEAARQGKAASRRSFDLARGPLLRLLLLRLHEREHVLAVAMHHIVSDGWSQGILLGELGRLYGALAAGAMAQLGRLPIQYADFAAWQRRCLVGEELDAMLAVWRARLAGARSTLDLPTDRPRTSARTLRGTTEEVRLEPEAVAALRALARQDGATLFMVLLAAFQALLHRTTGQDDLTVGSPIAGRGRPEIEPLIGFFVNTLVLRADLSGDPGFRELLRRTREVTLEAYGHPDLPFEKLVEELQPERTASPSPLFAAWLVLQNTPAASIRLPGLAIEPITVDSGTAKFDLHFALEEEADGGLTGVLEYASDLFDRTTILRWLGHFTGLAGQVGVDPERRIAELPLAVGGELHQLRVEWNDTGRPREDIAGSLLGRLGAVAAGRPRAVALVQGERWVSFAELQMRAERLASYLRARRIGPELRVGVFLDRSPELLVALLGILGAGASFVPLDPEYPAERLAYMIEDSGASCLLTVEKLAGRLPARAKAALEVLRLDADRDAIAASARPGGWREETDSSEQLAYVLYTSGSTGRPKGVMISRRGLDNYLRWALGTYDSAAGSGAPAHTPIGFDLTLTSLLLPLMAGNTVTLLAGDPGGGELAAVLRGRPDFSLLKLTPAHLDLLRHQLAAGETEGAARVLVIGGEALRGESLAEWRYHSPRTRMFNEYGPTETVVGCAVHEISDGDPPAGPVPIGRPIDNTEIYVLERGGGLAPIGLAGELAIGGHGLARGYLGRSDLTAAAFVPHPFGPDRGARLYRTGDLARRRPDGALEFLGRFDSQVKVRGFRIELGEIEASLVGHPAVLEAVALVQAEGADASLAAFVVARPGGEAGELPRELREFLRDRLPEHMIPSSFQVVASLPLTPNGKVDRQALISTALAPPVAEAAERAEPRTDLERDLIQLWRDLLKREEIGIHDNFFELGGHSMHAVRLVARVRKSQGAELMPGDLLDHPTVARLARHLEASRPAAKTLEAPPIRPAVRVGELPLSFAQQRLWLADRLEPSAVYNSPSALRLTGPLAVPVVERTLGEVVRRHEVLRTSFPEVGEGPVQRIAPPERLYVPLIEHSGLPAERREAEVRRLADEQGRQAFDLSRGPLFRTRLLRLAAEEHVLLFTLHHIVTDAWSSGIFVREVAALYAAFSEGRPSPLSELPIQYADYATWQREWLQGEALEAQLAYWKRQLAGELPVIDLAPHRPRAAAATARGAWRSFRVPEDLAAGLRDLSRSEEVTLFMTLLAGFQTFLFRLTGVDDVVVGTATAGRDRLETEGLIGFFVNMLPLRTNLTGNPKFRELLSRVRTVALGAYRHQELPFDLLVQELRPGREMSQSPFVEIGFSLNNVPRETLELAGLRLSTLDAERETARFDLTVWVRETDHGLTLDWTWKSDRFDSATIESLQGRFEALLYDAVERPEARLSSLEMRGAAQRRQQEVEEQRREADKIQRFKQRRTVVAVDAPASGQEELEK